MARIASASWGVVTRGELLAAGLTRAQIDHRLAKGLLLPEFRGVYRVGHRAPSAEARYLAAVRACGEGAVLSGRAAAHLWGLVKGSPPPPEVTAPGGRAVPGLRARRSNLRPEERTEWRGIPVTTVPRTLLDLAATLSPASLARACHEAGVKYRTTPAQVEALIHRNSKGAARLRRVLSGDERVTLSELERRFLALLRESDLPLPQTNRPAGSKHVDCRWPEHKLTVELDSYRFHNSRYAWEEDRRREREARARGDRFRRYTWHDVFEEPAPMRAELAGLLGQRVRASASCAASSRSWAAR